ncbi:VOC family protein [Mycobacterium aquaticum]|jgi:catechol 2,3-dioxygenase-like lactoylglutathione lyase family enzyme|nr:VOC family protein [Mycobacterium aquaticum]
MTINPTKTAPLKLKRLDNIDVVVNDFPRMVAFYRDVLGLPLHPHGYRPDRGWAMFMCGDVDLVLLSVPEAERTGRRRTSNYAQDPAGVHSFAAQVDDLDEAITTLDAHGVKWADDTVVFGAGHVLPSAPDGDFNGIWYRFRSFYDPEENVMHICEVHPPTGFDRGRQA